MPGSIVVGIDGSEVAKAALVFAAQEAELRGSLLIIAHAGSDPESVDPETEVRPLEDILSAEAIATIAAVHPHVDCRVVHRMADPGELLVELSESADLLVVGTHRTGRLRGWVLGSVSQFVAAHAACPVMTISGPTEHDGGPIVLGASVTPGGMAALRFACEQARLRNLKVHAVRAVTTEDRMLSGPGSRLTVGADVLTDVAESELNKVLDVAREAYPEVAISGEVAAANAFYELLRAATDASMLVIGSRRGRSSTLPHLGPVAAWLLHQATCPLVVVGNPGTDGDGSSSE
jgi:nucleotide-binding universal stress UspA family protein